ncbi:oligosaccharide flippase family protein [Flavobacterium psychrophilum]|uniref:oligosaccharide flippase family protein n=1 Tax=Flavobacterium psychrophilum TaxID=96345 RepID=UPI0019329494|nr:oligosaccharide flippase family protein [Flavobacterium psychrophilum]QRE06259.1 oligosaccharide flippase family protein [Flavobacterium psychrophilum]
MENESHSSNLNKDVLKYMLVKILPAISGLLTIYLLTRVLSAGLYSDYAFVMATILLFGQLISGWINSSVIYFYPDYIQKNKIDVLKLNIILLQFILYVLGAIGFSVMCYLGIKSFAILILGLLFMLSQTFINLLYSFLQAERRVLVQIRSTFIQSLVQIIGMVICFFYFKENLSAVFFVLFISYFLASNYVMYCDKIYQLILHKKAFLVIDMSISKEILSYGLPICIWFFASQFFVIGDRIVFKYFNITNLVGNYASFRDLSVGLSGFITMPLLMASHPIIIQMAKGNVQKEKIENIISQNIKLLSTLFTLVFIGIFFFGEWVLTYVVGTKYLLNANLMFLVVFSIFTGCISMYLHKGLEVKGKTLLMSKIALIVAVVSLVLNVFFIPIYGIQAACVTAVFSQVLYSFVVYRFSSGIFKIHIPFAFVLKNSSLILMSCIISNYILAGNSFLVIRMFIFVLFAVFLILSSAEIKLMVKLFKNK